MEKNNLKLLILAGGFGTRLRSALPNTAKALAPVGEKPFLELQLRNWIEQGIRSFVFLLHYHSDQIIAFLDSSKGGFLKNCEFECVVEPSPMDTGGAVAYAVRSLGLAGDFLVANADTWITQSIEDIIDSQAPSLAVIHINDTSRYGQVKFDDQKKVTAFTEKNISNFPGWINAGLYLLNAKMFNDWKGSRFSLEKNVFPELVQNRELSVVSINSDFIDIGIPEDYQLFCRWIEGDRKTRLCK